MTTATKQAQHIEIDPAIELRATQATLREIVKQRDVYEAALRFIGLSENACGDYARAAIAKASS